MCCVCSWVSQKNILLFIYYFYGLYIVLIKTGPVIFSNTLNKYCSVSIIFGTQNLLTVPNVYMY